MLLPALTSPLRFPPLTVNWPPRQLNAVPAVVATVIAPPASCVNVIPFELMTSKMAALATLTVPLLSMLPVMVLVVPLAPGLAWMVPVLTRM